MTVGIGQCSGLYLEFLSTVKWSVSGRIASIYSSAFSVTIVLPCNWLIATSCQVWIATETALSKVMLQTDQYIVSTLKVIFGWNPEPIGRNYIIDHYLARVCAAYSSGSSHCTGWLHVFPLPLSHYPFLLLLLQNGFITTRSWYRYCEHDQQITGCVHIDWCIISASNRLASDLRAWESE